MVTNNKLVELDLLAFSVNLFDCPYKALVYLIFSNFLQFHLLNPDTRLLSSNSSPKIPFFYLHPSCTFIPQLPYSKPWLFILLFASLLAFLLTLTAHLSSLTQQLKLRLSPSFRFLDWMPVVGSQLFYWMLYCLYVWLGINVSGLWVCWFSLICLWEVV